MITSTSRVSAATLAVATLVGSLALAAAAYAQAPAAPTTPRGATAHPYLGGVWNGANPNAAPAAPRDPNAPPANDPKSGPLFAGRGGSFYGFEEDAGLRRATFENKPIFKPEFWEQVNDNDYWANWNDPLFMCLPDGLPRIGYPVKIVDVPQENQVILFYQNKNTTRIIPTDGRAHDPARVLLESWYGDPVGRWDGDTLVIESTGFTNESWLHVNGYPHGFQMKVTERYTRTGNALLMEMTVEDPEYLQQPWVLAPATRYLNANPVVVQLNEDLPCFDRDRAVVGSHVRS